MNGVNEFKLQLQMVDVARITDLAEESADVNLVKRAIDAGASLEDIRTVEVLSALVKFMEERHCDPGFEVVIE